MYGQPSDSTLDTFLGHLIELKERSQRPLGLEDFKQAALELELGEADLAAADRAGTCALERGLTACRFRQWDEAIFYLELALLIDPMHIDGLHGTAHAHQGRWVESGREADRIEAVRLCRRCLKIDPCHAPSKRLLRELQKPWHWRC
jgi:tetratricopeptide (TPR) repeat protein